MFARAHTHIFYFVNDAKNFTFNDHAVRVPSDRQLIYNDKRANPIGKMPDDVWNQYPRVCGTFKERTSWHPCQMPESLLKRIIRVSSNAGDCVLDPFSGSGTTAAASFQLGRVYAGIDISEKYVEEAKRRLAGLAGRKERGLFGDYVELSELKQLLRDMGMSWKDVASSNNLLMIFTNQFNLRMNNGRKYDAGTVLGALEGLGC
jgi:DNA modification methylase